MATTAVRLSEIETLTEDERRALRASRFAGHSESTSGQPNRSRPTRLAHPGGTIATNKAAALTRFLQRKFEAGLSSELQPDLVDRAVRNAEASLIDDVSYGGKIKHVTAFEDPEVEETLVRSKDSKRKKKNQIQVSQWDSIAVASEGKKIHKKKNRRKNKKGGNR